MPDTTDDGTATPDPATPEDAAGSARGPGADAPPGRLARFRRSRWWRWGRWPLLAGGTLVAAGIVALTWIYITVELPEEPPQIESSKIVDAHGEELAVLQKDGLRVEVELDEVSPIVVEALLAAEDRSFRDHSGIDPVGILRAAKNNLGGGDTQGGSTLTQQLVKNTYLSPERTYRRKLSEAILAIKLDRSEDKDEILERYLNTVYFGRGAYGIEAAANVYFDTTAAELDLPQAALLVGLLRAPESADPTRDPETATERRNSVIDDLVEVEEITADEAEVHKASDLGATPVQSPVTLSTGLGAHVVEWVRAEAVERFGAEAVYGGGLTIEVTIDLAHQRAAEEAIAGILTEEGDPQAALVAIDGDGAIRAHVGGRDFQALQVDLARGTEGGGSGRQPGSTFKPVVLAAGLDDGTFTLGSTYPAPASLTLEPPSGPWEVGNYGGDGYGVTDLAEATARSINTVYAQLVLEVGPERAVEVAEALGITTELRPDPSLVLGSGEVSVLDMATAYSTLARVGEHVEPYLITRVTDSDGRTLFTAGEPQRRRAIDGGAALATTHALRGVIDGGTGTAAAIDRPAAGKTGTTQDNGDAWFAGYTPTYTAAVWMGYPEGPDRPMDDVRGGPVTGGGLPAEIWRAFMSAALEGVEPEEFPAPPDELLQPPEETEAEITLSPDRGPTGTQITVTATGLDQCIAGWSVALDPGDATSGPLPGSTDAERTATLVVPDGLGGGDARVIASCDRGEGPEPVAEAPFVVEAPETTTTTTEPAPTTTTTEPEEPPEPGPTTTTEGDRPGPPDGQGPPDDE